jgi:hypothetical protein
MSHSPDSPGVPFTPDARRRIADACTAFDLACRAGSQPRIEDHIPPDRPPEERRELLQGLLEIEFYYRRQAGATVNLDEYLRRFPGQSDVVRAAAQGQDTSFPGRREACARLEAALSPTPSAPCPAGAAPPSGGSFLLGPAAEGGHPA